MTKHPCAGMTQAQMRAFEALAVGMSPGCAPKTIKALLDRGVLVQSGQQNFRDGLGAYSVPIYDVPFAVHRQWCEWCSENVEDET
jgi:hypothetical protein